VTTNYQKHQQSLRIVEQILDLQETMERETRPWIRAEYEGKLKELRAQLDVVDRAMRSQGHKTPRKSRSTRSREK